MKKLILLIISISIFLSIQAQITIDENDMPNPGDTFRVSVTGNLGTLDPEPTGQNYTWNFSTLIPMSQRIDTFVSVLNTDAVYIVVFNNPLDQEHKATIVKYNFQPPAFNPQVQVSDYYDFLKETSSEYTKVGFGAKINSYPVPIKYDPPELLYTFPLQYGHTASSTSSFGIQGTNLGFDGYYGQTINRVNTVDGWGTLTTPFGTFDVMRVKSIINITDTIYSDSLGFGTTFQRPTEYEYKWLGDNQGIPLLQINEQSYSTTVIYRDSVRNLTSLNEHNLSQYSVNIYPNPAKDYIIIQVQGSEFKGQSLELRIYDLLGNEVIRSVIPSGAKNLLIRSNNLSAGIYFVKIKTNKEFYVQKIILE